jgi:hypothetical protein
MNKVEIIEEFYERKPKWMPDGVRNQVRHLTMFQAELLLEKIPSRFLICGWSILRLVCLSYIKAILFYNLSGSI